MKSIDKSEFQDILALITEARQRTWAKVNEELVSLYFKVGKIVSQKVSEGVWGDGTVDELSRFIAAYLPALKGFDRRGLYRMKQFYEAYSIEQFVTPLATQMQLSINDPEKFVSTLLTQLQWSSHLHILSKTKSPEEKLFYLNLAIKEKLSVRELERQLNSAVFERTLLAKEVVSTALTQPLPQNYFKDPYIFEFLDLPESHSEGDLKRALISNLKNFILEIGKGFTYMGNQFRLQVGNKDFFTDLLFYNRDLRCLVLFELKIEEFQPEFLGKLNFYLEALDRDIKRPDENPSIGILLCKGKDFEVVEYAMARNISPALIADYETKLIPKNVLQSKLIELSSFLDQNTDTEINL